MADDKKDGGQQEPVDTDTGTREEQGGRGSEHSRSDASVVEVSDTLKPARPEPPPAEPDKDST